MSDISSEKKIRRQPVERTSAPLLEVQVAKLRQLFPETVSEGKIDFDKLRGTLGDSVETRRERFSFTWAGKQEAIALLQTPSRATLIPCPEESINFDTTQHMFIEGDNLEVLKLLFKSYFGRVKMIYIDPPYNTGQDFIYPDNYADPLATYLQLTGQIDSAGNLLTSNPETSGRYHSAWLSMMYPRLFLARQLLTEDGVIFVSIDDHEAHHLRLVMNEVFGEENFVATLVWNTEGHTDNQFQIKVNHEYVVVYAREAEAVELGFVVDPNTRKESNLWKGFAENSITKNGPGNPPTEVKLPTDFPCAVETLDLKSSDASDEFFKAVEAQGYITREITQRFTVDYPVRKSPMRVKDSKLVEECTVFSGWANVNKLKAFIQNACRPLEEDGTTLEFFLSDRGVIYYKRNRPSARNILSVLRNMGTTEQMRSELERLGIVFQYPKPKQLLKYITRIGAQDTDSLVLDFFAGSCTTAQAVLELNREDGGNRKFLMVQLPEPMADKKYTTIAEIGKERIRRVVGTMEKEIEGTFPENRERPEDLGFKVFRLAASNYEPWTGVPERDAETYIQLMSTFTDPLIKDWRPVNVIWEVAIKEGYGLNSRIEKVESLPGAASLENTVYRVTDLDKDQLLRICLDDEITPELANALNLATDDLFICRDKALDDSLAANLALQCRLKTI